MIDITFVDFHFIFISLKTTCYEGIRINAPASPGLAALQSALHSASLVADFRRQWQENIRAASLLVHAAGNSVRPSRGSNRTEVGLDHESQECFSCFASFFRRVRRGFVSILARDLGGVSDNMYGSE
jgi:hypothetical protein